MNSTTPRLKPAATRRASLRAGKPLAAAGLSPAVSMGLARAAEQGSEQRGRGQPAESPAGTLRAGRSPAMAGGGRSPELGIVTLVDEGSAFCFPEKSVGNSLSSAEASVVSQSREDPSWEQSAEPPSVPRIFFLPRTEKCRNEDNCSGSSLSGPTEAAHCEREEPDNSRALHKLLSNGMPRLGHGVLWNSVGEYLSFS